MEDWTGSLRDLNGRGLRRRQRWVLVLGFLATAIPLLMLATVGFAYARTLEDAAQQLAESYERTGKTLDRVRRGQAAVRAVVRRLALMPGAAEEDAIIEMLAQLRSDIHGSAQAGEEVPPPEEWAAIVIAHDAFGDEAKRLLELPAFEANDLDVLFELQEASTNALRDVVDTRWSAVALQSANLASRADEVRALLVYGGMLCLLLAAAAAALTIRTTSRMIQQSDDNTETLRQVTALLFEKQETAARRFSHEMHDELGQTLAAAKAEVAALAVERRPGRDPQAAALELLDDAIRSVREISHLLHPRILDDLGLAEALRSLTDGFSARTGIEATFETDFEGRLPDVTRKHLYRIAQEALTNVARHADASAVRIQLLRKGTELELEISDNGKGLPVVNTQSGGIGLRGMEARAAFASGTLRLCSAPGEGLRIRVRVPVQEKNAIEPSTHQSAARR